MNYVIPALFSGLALFSYLMDAPGVVIAITLIIAAIAWDTDWGTGEG